MSSQKESEVTLFCGWFCPFAQRSWIALEEKGFPYKYVEVNPYERPENLVRANPKSMVPAIDHHGVGAFGESLVINEYLDEAFPDTKALLPKTPYLRAKCRIFVDGVVSKQITPLLYKILKARGDERKNYIELCDKAVKEIVAQLEESGGPFLMGKEFGFADVALAPFIPVRCDIMRRLADYDPVKAAGSKKLEEWCEKVTSRKSVRKTMAEPDKLLETYKRYADGTATSKVAAAVKAGLPLP